MGAYEGLAIQDEFLGYDVAYPGGDFYSAIKNGLFVNPDMTLVKMYKHLLNSAGLFSSKEYIPEFVRHFKEVAPTEENSEFSIFNLFAVKIF